MKPRTAKLQLKSATQGSCVAAFVIPTNEELEIATRTLRISMRPLSARAFEDLSCAEEATGRAMAKRECHIRAMRRKLCFEASSK